MKRLMDGIAHSLAWKFCCLILLAPVSLSGCGNVETAGEGPGDAGEPAADGPQPVAVFLEPGAAVVREGETLGFEAVAVYASGETATITDKSEWSSTNPDVMEVSNEDESKGMGTAMSQGTSTVRARTPQGLQAEAAIEVVPSTDSLVDDIRNSLPVDLYPSTPTDFPLYIDVANEITFEATNLGDEYTVELEDVRDGVVGSAEPERTFIISPAADTMTFDVVVANSDRSERFEDITYTGRLAPEPRIQLYNIRRGREVERGIDVSDIISLELNALADDEFQSAYPDDAAVRIADVTVTLDRTSGSSLVRSFSSGDIDLFDFRTPASAGDSLYIEIHEVERLNYRDEVVDQTEFYPRTFYVPLE